MASLCSFSKYEKSLTVMLAGRGEQDVGSATTFETSGSRAAKRG